jgi:DNA-binding NarL/FixJ family response regulator
MKLLLIDDHVLFAKGFQFLLFELDPTLHCDMVHRLSELPRPRLGGMGEAHAYDLILLDYHLPDSKGVESLAHVKTIFPDVPVVILSGEESPALIRQMVDAGAAGFIAKATQPQLMVAALKLVLAGGVYLPPEALQHIQASQALASHPMVMGMDQTASKTARQSQPQAVPPEVANLSRKQLEVLLKAVSGKTNKIIAREMALAEGTVKAHLSLAYRCLGVSNRTEALFKAAQLGLQLPLASNE